jgi:hypothetical protein
MLAPLDQWHQADSSALPIGFQLPVQLPALCREVFSTLVQQVVEMLKLISGQPA